MSSPAHHTRCGTEHNGMPGSAHPSRLPPEAPTEGGEVHPASLCEQPGKKQGPRKDPPMMPHLASIGMTVARYRGVYRRPPLSSNSRENGGVRIDGGMDSSPIDASTSTPRMLTFLLCSTRLHESSRPRLADWLKSKTYS